MPEDTATTIAEVGESIAEEVAAVKATAGTTGAATVTTVGTAAQGAVAIASKLGLSSTVTSQISTGVSLLELLILGLQSVGKL